ncbi:MAG TPA: hypothetical protein VE569_04180 [Acidimicrobiia bacterium]|nr:hypothetical protein [Acidimicrobiia bacterium]
MALPSVDDVLLPVLTTILLAVVVADLVLRWRRSSGVERLQMRWVGLGLPVVILLSVAGLITDTLGFTNQMVWVAVWLGFGALPVAVGLAVARYRLYEIDRLVSRTVSYAMVVGVLAGLSAAIAIGIPQLLDLTGDTPPLLVAGATLAVVGLFNPLRRRVQALVDRRFNQARYNAQQEVGEVRRRLRDQIRLDDISHELIDVAAKTMQPATAGVWIRGRRVGHHLGKPSEGWSRTDCGTTEIRSWWRRSPMTSLWPPLECPNSPHT